MTDEHSDPVPPDPHPQPADATVLGPSTADASAMHPTVRPGPPSSARSDATAAATSPAPVSGESGKQFGPYRLVRQLGAGGMGVVWHAFDPQLRRHIALKHIHAGTGHPEAVARFQREARLAARLRHPGIVAVHDVGVADGRHYIAMEYVEGRTLAEALAARKAARGGTYAALQTGRRQDVRLLAEIAEAVACAHREGVLHRDLKPGNVLVDSDGRARVTDFGLAREVTEESGASAARLTQAGQLLGTPAYMSPEQAVGDLDRLGPPTDVWALGVMLYEILTGALPIEAASSMERIAALVRETVLPRPSLRDPSVPPELDAICAKALEWRPADRYADAGALAQDLQRWLAGDPIAARPLSRSRALRRWAGRHRTLLAAVLVVVTLTGAGTLWATLERGRRQARTRAALADISARVQSFVDVVMGTNLDPEGVQELARQPLAVLDGVIAEDPEHGPAWAWRALVFQFIGDPDRAGRDYDQAWKLAPDWSIVCVLRGLHRLDRYHALRGQPEVVGLGAGVEFLPQDPESPEQTALREGALRDLSRIDAEGMRAEGLSESYRLLARAHLALVTDSGGGAAQVVQWTEGAKEPQALQVRTVALYRLGRFEAAAEAGAATLVKWPRDVQTLAVRAAALRALVLERLAGGGDLRTLLRSAEEATAEAIRLRPQQSQLHADAAMNHRLMAEQRFLAGDPTAEDAYAQAEAAYATALTLTPENLDLRAQRGTGRLERALARLAAGQDPTRDLDQAWQDFEVAVRALPADPLLRMHRGAVLATRGGALESAGADGRELLRAGLVELDEAIRLRPAATDAYINRAEARAVLFAADASRGAPARDELTRAIEDLDRALQLHPGHAVALAQRARIRMDLGGLDQREGKDPGAAWEAALADAEASKRATAVSLNGWLQCSHALRRLAQREATQGKDPRPRLRAAMAELDELLAHNGSVVHALHNRAAILLDLAKAEASGGGDPGPWLDRAQADLDRALAARPGWHEALNSRGLVHTRRAASLLTARGDPEPEWALGLADFAAALTAHSGSVAVLRNRASLLAEQAQYRVRGGGDALPILRAAVSDLSAARERDARAPAVAGERGSLYLLIAQLMTARGLDARPELRLALADLDAELTVTPGAAVTRLNRGVSLCLLASLEQSAGADPGDRMARGLDDLRIAAEAGQGLGWLNLAMYAEAEGRIPDAIRAWELGARALPVYAERATREIARLRAAGTVAPAADEPWLADWRSADAAFDQDDYAAAQPAYERGLSAWAKVFGMLGPAEQQQWLDQGEHRVLLVNVAYNQACVYAVLSAGRTGPTAAPQELEPARRAAFRDRAFALLEQVRRLGLAQRAHYEGDADLTPLHDDPRWAKFLEQTR